MDGFEVTGGFFTVYDNGVNVMGYKSIVQDGWGELFLEDDHAIRTGLVPGVYSVTRVVQPELPLEEQ
jgi:hypothetical protein